MHYGVLLSLNKTTPPDDCCCFDLDVHVNVETMSDEILADHGEKKRAHIQCSVRRRVRMQVHEESVACWTKF